MSSDTTIPDAAVLAGDPTVDHRLDTEQMARFVADGFLRFDAVVPEDLCAAALREMQQPEVLGRVWQYGGRPFRDLWRGTATKAVFDLPQVRGVIASLVGSEPRYDHHCPHQVGPGQRREPNLHQDAVVDLRPDAFDIQLSFFPHAVPEAMGGTSFLPGSHFRRPRLNGLQRYHHVVGEVQTVCPAGTVVVWHHNLWHAARSNRTEHNRYMFKLRLNPTCKQVRLWNTADIASAPVQRILNTNHHWYGAEYRFEVMQRLQLWRHLSGDPTYDDQSFWTRLENRPTTVYQTPWSCGRSGGVFGASG